MSYNKLGLVRRYAPHIKPLSDIAQVSYVHTEQVRVTLTELTELCPKDKGFREVLFVSSIRKSCPVE